MDWSHNGRARNYSYTFGHNYCGNWEVDEGDTNATTGGCGSRSNPTDCSEQLPWCWVRADNCQITGIQGLSYESYTIDNENGDDQEIQGMVRSFETCKPAHTQTRAISTRTDSRQRPVVTFDISDVEWSDSTFVGTGAEEPFTAVSVPLPGLKIESITFDGAESRVEGVDGTATTFPGTTASNAVVQMYIAPHSSEQLVMAEIDYRDELSADTTPTPLSVDVRIRLAATLEAEISAEAAGDNNATVLAALNKMKDHTGSSLLQGSIGAAGVVDGTMTVSAQTCDRDSASTNQEAYGKRDFVLNSIQQLLFCCDGPFILFVV